MNTIVLKINGFFNSIVRPLFCLEGGLIAMMLSYYLLNTGSQEYNSLIAGKLAEINSIKNGEYVALALIPIVSIALYMVITYYQEQLNEKRNDKLLEGLITLCSITQIPAMIWISSLIWQTGILSIIYPLFSFIFTLIVIIFGVIISRGEKKFNSIEDVFDFIGGFLFPIIISMFSGLGICLTLFRIFGCIKCVSTISIYITSFIYILTCFVISLVALKLVENNKKNNWSHFLNFFAQLGIPLLYLHLLPSIDLDLLSQIKIKKTLYFLIIGIVIVSYLDLFIRAKKNIQLIKPKKIFFPPLLALAILVYIKIPNTNILGWFPTDFSEFYHKGENLLPWELLWQYGQIPYWDHLPARGLDNYLRSICASLFFSPDAPGWYFAGKISAGFYIVFLFFLLRSVVGSLPAFILLLFCPIRPLGIIAINGLCAAALVWLIALRNRVENEVWPVLWILVGTGLVIYAPAQGGLTVLATLPIGLYWLFLAIKESPQRTFKLLSLTFLCAAIILIFTGTGKMLLGAIRYALEQAPVNIIANGIPWKSGYLKDFGINPILWEILRSSWIIVGFLAGCLAYHDWRENKQLGKATIAAFGLTVFLLAILYIPRVACRIGLNWSRMGNLSLVFLLLYFPLLFFWGPKLRNVVAGTLLLSIVYGITPKPLLEWEHSRLEALSQIPLPNSVFKPILRSNQSKKLINAEDYGLPSLGMTEMPAEKLEELSNIKKILDRFIRPGETYLDLTSKNANYFIFNYPPPIDQ